MPSTQPADTTNLLLAALPVAERRQVLAACELVELAFNKVLYEPGDTAQYVYFPDTSIISEIMPVDAHSALEVGLVGYEGMHGASLVLGVATSPLRALVQGGGLAQRMKAAPFRQALRDGPVLRAMLQRYVYVLLAQMAQMAACTRFHVVEARLARWLLMTRDRAQSDHFRVTHEFLAMMLGVRRVGVTKAAVALHDRELIHYHRGDITILDNSGLEAASCSCYAADQQTYARVMHSHGTHA